MNKLTVWGIAMVLLLVGCSEDAKEKQKEKEVAIPVVEEKVIEDKEEEVIIPEVELSPTTGVAMDDKYHSKNQFAAMIENSPKARPQTGLVNADIVYEMEVEATITRFLAIFKDDMPEKVGPMRSSRHYFIPIAESWNVPYIHFGGSPQAYKKLKASSVPTIDGIYEGVYFSRDNSRKAPHNAYLHTERLKKYDEEVKNGKFEYGMNNYESAKDVHTITISYNHFTNVKYKYDESNKVYERFLEGKPHLDRKTSEQIVPTNIVILYAKHSSVKGDTSGRIDVDLTSTGEAVFFTAGKLISGKWVYEEDGINFYVGEKLVELNAGKTWIQVVDVNKKNKVSYE